MVDHASTSQCLVFTCTKFSSFTAVQTRQQESFPRMSSLDESSPSVSNLFPAIAQSFAVIIIGYVFGYFKIIPPSEARSIGTLVGKLALPALLFKNLAILDLSSISWSFLGGMLIAKFSLFLGVVIITLLVTRPFSVGRAGLYGIFATQSNDFALGLPIGKMPSLAAFNIEVM